MTAARTALALTNDQTTNKQFLLCACYTTIISVLAITSSNLTANDWAKETAIVATQSSKLF